MACSLVVVLQALQGLAQQNSDASKTSVQNNPTERDGQHDQGAIQAGAHVHQEVRVSIQEEAELDKLAVRERR